MDKLSGADDLAKFESLCKRTYKDQAIWYLNAFWEEGAEQQAEQLWDYVQKFQEIDEAKKADGNAVDELNAHRFLEYFNETQTVMEMRTNLREAGAIPKTGRPKDFPITHFLVAKNKTDFHKLVNAIQGGNKEEIAKATAMLDAVVAAFQESEARASEARIALNEAQSKEAEAKRRADESSAAAAAAKVAEEAALSREAEAKAAEADALAREAPFKAAQEELEAAVAEVKAQEDAYNNKTADLTAKGEAGGVSGMRAKNELAQHLAEDPLPLRKAKITQEAALKKAAKFREPFLKARESAEAARAVATEAANAATESANAATRAANEAAAAAERASQARQASEDAKHAAEAALAEAEAKVAEAEAYLEEVKSSMPYGQMWWLDRQLTEQRKYLPMSKGGIAKK